MSKVLAAVRTGPSRTEIREFPMPEIPEDAALLKMEVAGICGTDVKLYKHPPNAKPTIMGHENIGYIAKAGREFTQRKGLPSILLGLPGIRNVAKVAQRDHAPAQVIGSLVNCQRVLAGLPRRGIIAQVV